jgi:NADPH2:quinone reductase
VRAAVYSRTGDPDVLTVLDVADPAPGPGEVLVRIHRSGVNPTDWKARRGSGDGDVVDPPQVPGQDGAGVVDAVGPGVDRGLVGQRVWVWEAAYQRPQGTAQELCVVPVQQAVPLPDSASFDQGASIGIPFLTAHRCLTVAEDSPKQLGAGALSGRMILVAGGAGAVGNAAIQLARWSGATVITTVSDGAKAELAAAAGADHVINYREQDVAAAVRRIAPNGVDDIVEVAPAINIAIDLAVVAKHGVVAVYGNNGGMEVTLPIREQMLPNVRWQFVLVYTVPTAAKVNAVDGVADALAQGAIRIGDEVGLPIHHFPLEQTAAAHGVVERSIVGKVLIDVMPVTGP